MLPIGYSGEQWTLQQDTHCCSAHLVLLAVALASRDESMVAGQAAVETPEAEPVLRAEQLLNIGLSPRSVYNVHVKIKQSLVQGSQTNCTASTRM